MEKIITIKYLRSEIKKELGLDLSPGKLRTILVKEMGLKWRRARPQARYVNSPDNIKLRKVFAFKMMKVLDSDIVIINFDETVVRGTSGRNYTWAS